MIEKGRLKVNKEDGLKLVNRRGGSAFLFGNLIFDSSSVSSFFLSNNSNASKGSRNLFSFGPIIATATVDQWAMMKGCSSSQTQCGKRVILSHPLLIIASAILSVLCPKLIGD